MYIHIHIYTYLHSALSRDQYINELLHTHKYIHIRTTTKKTKNTDRRVYTKENTLIEITSESVS